jgi:glycosyltransferase involved in cell wall biosynthesis
MRVALIAKPGYAHTGVGRYVAELEQALRLLGHDVVIVNPIVPLPVVLQRWLKRWLGIDLAAFLSNYPIWARYPVADVYHLTSQNLATLMLFRPPPGKTVITVHDIIPWLVRRNPELRVYRHWLDATFDHLALRCLDRADALIADSEFTARSLAMVG